MDLRDVRHETFLPLVGDTFRTTVDDDVSVDLELTEARRATGQSRPDNAFWIVFRGPRERFLDQRIYELEHTSLGRLPIFLVPVAQDEAGYLYQAVFTRLEGEAPTP